MERTLIQPVDVRDQQALHLDVSPTRANARIPFAQGARELMEEVAINQGLVARSCSGPILHSSRLKER